LNTLIIEELVEHNLEELLVEGINNQVMWPKGCHFSPNQDTYSMEIDVIENSPPINFNPHLTNS